MEIPTKEYPIFDKDERKGKQIHVVFAFIISQTWGLAN